MRIITRCLTVMLILLFSSAVIFGAGAAERVEPPEVTSIEDLKDQSFTFIIGFGAGGSTDLSARLLADGLNKMGLDVTVVNRPGGLGTEAAAWVMDQSPRDNIWAAVVPLSFYFLPASEDTGFTWRDFDPVATWGGVKFCFAVHADSPFESLQDVFDYGKAKPGELLVGSQGEDTNEHYVCERLMASGGVDDFTYISFAGGADVATNLLGKHIDVGYMSISAVKSMVDAGDLRILAHNSLFMERLPFMPDIPNITEYGIDAPHFNTLALWAPKGTSESVRRVMGEAIKEVITDQEMIERHRAMGIELAFLDIEGTRSTAEDTADQFIEDYLDWLD